MERQENHSISRAALAKALGRSGPQVRKAIDVLRDKRIRRKGGMQFIADCDATLLPLGGRTMRTHAQTN